MYTNQASNNRTPRSRQTGYQNASNNSDDKILDPLTSDQDRKIHQTRQQLEAALAEFLDAVTGQNSETRHQNMPTPPAPSPRRKVWPLLSPERSPIRKRSVGSGGLSTRRREKLPARRKRRHSEIPDSDADYSEDEIFNDTDDDYDDSHGNETDNGHPPGQSSGSVETLDHEPVASPRNRIGPFFLENHLNPPPSPLVRDEANHERSRRQSPRKSSMVNSYNVDRIMIAIVEGEDVAPDLTDAQVKQAKLVIGAKDDDDEEYFTDNKPPTRNRKSKSAIKTASREPPLTPRLNSYKKKPGARDVTVSKVPLPERMKLPQRTLKNYFSPSSRR